MAARFEWRVLADATCAGLSVLVPVPVLDVLLERMFRRRIPRSICLARGVVADPTILRSLGRAEPLFGARGCLLAPFALLLYLLKRLSRKIFYVLTIHEATNALSAYWHRAYLIDYLARRGHLASGPQPETVAAVESALDQTPTTALYHVARQAMLGARHVFRGLLGARRIGAEAFFGSVAAILEEQWTTVAEHLEDVVARYESLKSDLSADEATAEGGGNAT